MKMKRHYTQAQATAILRDVGIAMRKNDGEYRVTFANLRGDDAERAAYYTFDIDDAVATGCLMNAH
jgi:hypothetical protein